MPGGRAPIRSEGKQQIGALFYGKRSIETKTAGMNLDFTLKGQPISSHKGNQSNDDSAFACSCFFFYFPFVLRREYVHFLPEMLCFVVGEHRDVRVCRSKGNAPVVYGDRHVHFGSDPENRRVPRLLSCPYPARCGQLNFDWPDISDHYLDICNTNQLATPNDGHAPVLRSITHHWICLTRQILPRLQYVKRRVLADTLWEMKILPRALDWNRVQSGCRTGTKTASVAP